MSNNKSAAGAVALLVGTRKGAFILRGDKTRRKWKLPDGMMIGAIVNDMVMDSRGSRTILMSASTGHLGPTVFRSTDLGKSWKEATQPPAFPKAREGETGISVHHNFWISPAHASEPGVWYLGTSPQGLFRSEDDGAIWEPVNGFNQHPQFKTWWNAPDEGPPDGPTLHSVMIDPRDANHMLLCLSGGGVFESHDKGRDWHPLNKGLVSDFLTVPDGEVGHDPHRVEMNPLDPDRFYMQNHVGVYTMDRKKGVWENIGKKLPRPYSDHSYPIVTHPRDPATVWIFPLDGSFPLGRVSPNGKPAAFVSHNAGKTWQKQNKGFPKRDGWFSVKRQAMNADMHDPVGLYLGTTGGEIWMSRNEGEAWTRLLTSLPEIYSVRAAEL